MNRLRVGIVGCGEVTQLLHLPSLAFLWEQFEVTAACDVSPGVLTNVADRWHIAHRHGDYRQLVENPDVDAVLVANPDTYHAEVTAAAIRAGKHLLIEKPMCINLREADEITAAHAKSNVVVQVGYMRRYAGAFMEALDMLPELGPIRLARVHDVIGHNHFFTKEAGRVIRANDIPKDVLDSGAAQRERLIAEAIGDAPPALREAYSLLLGLGSHDISVMRDMLGMPKRVLYASARQGGRYLTAAFDYGDFICHYETGIDDIPRFDAGIKVFGQNKILSVSYNTPYVRNLPITLHVTAEQNGSLVDRDIHPSWEDAFVAEWRQFHTNIIQGRTPRTPAADFRDDLELFAKMIASMRETAAVA